MTMTLNKLRDDLREWQAQSHKDRFQYPENKCAPGECEFLDWADAIDAHIAAMGEPVAWQKTLEPHKSHPSWQSCGRGEAEKITRKGVWDDPRPTGLSWPAKARALYLAPPASGDWDAVRRVRYDLRAGFWDSAGMANRLTAALPENAK